MTNQELDAMDRKLIDGIMDWPAYNTDLVYKQSFSPTRNDKDFGTCWQKFSELMGGNTALNQIDGIWVAASTNEVDGVRTKLNARCEDEDKKIAGCGCMIETLGTTKEDGR